MDVKCYDVAKMILSDYAKNHGDLKINHKRLSKFEETCKAIDVFAAECDATGYDVEVDESTGEIKISVLCEEIIIDDIHSMFYDAVYEAKKILFTNGDSEDSIIVTLIFDSMFSKTE